MNCPVCSNFVSSEATACPKCGHPIKRTATETARWIIGTIMVLGFLGWLAWYIVWNLTWEYH